MGDRGDIFARFLSILDTRRALAALAVIGMELWLAGASAAVPAPLPAPNLALVTDGEVDAIAIQPDGGIVLGGSFSSIDGVARANIARLAPDGTLDMSWNPSADGSVLALAVDASTGAVFAGGMFRNIGGASRTFIAKLTDGAADPDWQLNADGTVRALLADPSSGSIFAAGEFGSIGGQTRLFLAKLSADGAGAIDADWNPAPNSYVYALALDAQSGALYVGGNFTILGGQTRNYLAKLPTTGTGAADGTWNPSADAKVLALAIDTGASAIYAGGQFSRIGNQAHRSVAKIDATGAGLPRAEWAIGGADGYVHALAIDAGGGVCVGGIFSNIGSRGRRDLARLTGTAGSADASWNPSPDGDVKALAADATYVYAGGSFANIGSAMHLGFAVLAGGNPIDAVDVEQHATILALATQTGGGTIVGGDFVKADQIVRHYILRLEADGTLDPNWNPSADGAVRALSADVSGDVVVGGDFLAIGGLARHHIARLSGSGSGAADATWDPNSEGPVLSFAPDPTGHFIYAAGDYFAIGGALRQRLAKLSIDGTGAADPSWNPMADQTVLSVAVDPNDGSVFAGGVFSNVGGRHQPYLAKLSGTGTGAADASWNPSLLGGVYALAVDPVDDALYAGGTFVVFGSQSRSSLAKFSAGSPDVVDPSWKPQPSEYVYALAIDPLDRSLYVGGAFIRIGGQERSHFAKLSTDGAGSAASDWNPSANGEGRAFALDASGNTVAVGGTFSTIGGQSREGLAVLPVADPHGTNITIVQQPIDTLPGEVERFQVHVSSDAGVPTGSVDVSGGAYVCSAVLDANGDGVCTIAFEHVGTFLLTATYAGDGTFAASSSAPFAHNVDFGDVTLAVLGSEPNPSALTQPVTFTVSLTPTSPATTPPTGSVILSDGVNGCTVAQGSTTCLFRFTTRGPRTITARYAGDGNYRAATATAIHNVNRLPVAADDTYVSNEDAAMTVDADHGLLSNDSDVDGDAMSIASVGFVAVSGIGGTALVAADGSFTYTPPADAFGTASFSYTMTDGLETANAIATITINSVNDAPSFSLAASPSWPAGTGGSQTLPAFATVTSFGPPNEADQHVAAWIVRTLDDPNGVAADVAVAEDGTLSYTLSGNAGMGTFAIALRDDGGVANGGSDTSPEQTFTIAVAGSTDLSIAIDDGISFVAGGSEITYTIVVRNEGQSGVVGARVVDALPSNLAGATWTCTPEVGAACSASGSGDLDDTVDIAAGATLSYELTATALADPERPIDNTATIAAPAGIPDANPGNDSASDVDVVGLFADGFDGLP